MLEWKHGFIDCQTPGLHLCGGYAESHHRGGHHHNDGKGCSIFKNLNLRAIKLRPGFGESNEAFSVSDGDRKTQT